MLNQKMTVQIGEHQFQIEHKTMIGNLNQFWAIGNSYRIAKGLTPKHLDNWLRSQETAEFVRALERDLKCVNLTDLEKPLKKNKIGKTIGFKSDLIKTKRGQGGGTWAHLYILLDAATHLDADFKVLIYKSFVENNILKNRDDAGNLYAPMTRAIARLVDKQGDDIKPFIISIANLIADKIGRPKAQNGENRWNHATAGELIARTEIERKVIDFINLKLIKDFEHLKHIIINV